MKRIFISLLFLFFMVLARAGIVNSNLFESTFGIYETFYSNPFTSTPSGQPIDGNVLTNLTASNISPAVTLNNGGSATNLELWGDTVLENNSDNGGGGNLSYGLNFVLPSTALILNSDTILELDSDSYADDGTVLINTNISGLTALPPTQPVTIFGGSISVPGGSVAAGGFQINRINGLNASIAIQTNSSGPHGWTLQIGGGLITNAVQY